MSKINCAPVINAEHLRQIEELYHAAREREPTERAAFIREACGDNQELRCEVESLLANDSLSGLLDRPAWGSITGSDPFPPLPTEFTGPYLALRFRFYYNPDKGEIE